MPRDEFSKNSEGYLCINNHYEVQFINDYAAKICGIDSLITTKAFNVEANLANEMPALYKVLSSHKHLHNYSECFFFSKYINAMVYAKVLIQDNGAEIFFKHQIPDTLFVDSVNDTLRHFHYILKGVKDGMLLVHHKTRKIIYSNDYLQKLLGYSLNEMAQLNVSDLHPVAMHAEVDAAIRQIDENITAETDMLSFKHKNGHLIDCSVYAFLVDISNEKYICCIIKDASHKKWSSVVLESENALLKLISGRFELPKVLKDIVLNIESLLSDTIGSILLLQEDGKHVTYGAAPNLPKGYNDALEGAAIGSVAGSCGTAMFLQKSVIVDDIATNPLWVHYKDLALKYDLKACWSTPIIGTNGKVLGSFALYYKTTRKPTDKELIVIEQATYLARLAIEKSNYEMHLLAAKLLAQENENRYKILFRDNPQPMWVYKIDTLKIIDANEAAINKYGYTREEFMQSSILDIRPKSEHSLVKESVSKRHQKLANSGIWKHQKKDGTIIDVEINSSIINKEAGEVLVLANDVTERLNAERDLRKKDTDLRVILDTALESIWFIDNNFIIQYANKIVKDDFEKMFGIPLVEGNNILSLLPEDIKEFWLLIYNRVLGGEEIKMQKEISYGKHKMYLDISMRPITIDHKVSGVAVFAKNITVQHIALMHLKQSEDRFKTLFIENAFPMYLYDPETGNITDVNPACEVFYGWNKKAFLQKKITEICIGEVCEKEISLYEQEGFVLKRFEAIHQLANGEKKDVEVFNSLLYVNDKRQVHTIVNDITERNQYLQALLKQNQLLKDIAWEQSHTVRAPLSRLMGLVQLLEANDYSFADADDPIKNQEDTIQAIKSSADELDNFIQKITHKTYQ